MNPSDRTILEKTFSRYFPEMEIVDGPALNEASFAPKDPKATFCDFCEATPVAKTFAARDVVVNAIPSPSGDGSTIALQSNGAWGACAACAELIDLGAKDRLLKRAYDLHVGKFDRDFPPDVRPAVHEQQRANFRRSQAAFWKAKIG